MVLTRETGAIWAGLMSLRACKLLQVGLLVAIVGLALLLPPGSREDLLTQSVRSAGPAQARVFQRIASTGSRLTELAAQAGITKQSAGFLVDQLERSGYVERTAVSAGDIDAREIASLAAAKAAVEGDPVQLPPGRKTPKRPLSTGRVLESRCTRWCPGISCFP